MQFSSERRFTVAALLAIAAVAFYWSIARYPSPANLLSDHGQGYQLAGASEILAGRYPFIDFKDTYGPLTHYASAMGQVLAGGRVGGELALEASSLALGAACLLWLMLRCAVPEAVALTAGVVAIVVQPVGWRYYMLLLPMMFFVSAWRYADVPGAGRAWVMALTVTLAGLFRPDLGCFTFVAGAVMVAAMAGSAAAAARRTAGFTAAVLVWALPWLGWMAVHGGLTDYLVHSAIDPIRDAMAMARPAPPFDFGSGLLGASNAKAWLFRLPGLMLALAVAMLAIRWRALGGAQRARLLCAATFAVLSQLQGSHIVDWIHVRDTLPVRILLLAWIAAPVAGDGFGPHGRRWGWRAVPPAVAGLVGLSLLAAGLGKEPPGSLAPGRVAAKLRAYAVSRDELLAGVRERRENFRARLYEYVRDHSRPAETVFAVIEAPQLNYFANRRLAGGQLAILPGYFASPEAQRELIEKLRRGPTAFVVLDHPGMDEYPELSLEKFAPEFYAFLMRDFVEVRRIGYCRVLAPRGRTAPGSVTAAGGVPETRRFP